MSPKAWRRLIPLAVILLGVLAFWILLGDSGSAPAPPAKNFTELTTRVKADDVKEISVDQAQSVVTVTETDEAIPPYQIGVPRADGADEGMNLLLRLARQHQVTVSSIPVDLGEGIGSTLARVVPMVLFVALLIALFGYNFGWFNRLGIEPAPANVSFADVAGCGEAVEELQDVRSFLRDPKRFERLGARVPKGVLLHGAPGTGKTLLAKAVANEAGIPFFSASGSEFIEMFAGLGARRVRQLFERAKRKAPSIIFIDELDAVGSHRSAGGGDGASREADQTLIQILKEMDGFSVSEHPVIVIGATNRLEALDRALLRPGRFDRHISIDPPDRRGRREILEVHSRGKRLGSDIDFDSLAAQTSGMTGADLALILNEAALLAARRSAAAIEHVDIDDAYFRVIAGAKKQHRMLSEREREIVAFHECGHALVGERLQGSEKVHKVSIIPRGKSGGQTLYVSEDDIFLHSEEALNDRICGLLAGRAAEELVFKQTTSGASDDLDRASDLAYKMLTKLGMSQSLRLRVALDDAPLSEDLINSVDEEIKILLDRQYGRAKEILAREAAILNQLTETLLVEETLDRERFAAIVGTDPGKPTPEPGLKLAPEPPTI